MSWNTCDYGHWALKSSHVCVHMSWDYKEAGVLSMAVSDMPGVEGSGSITVTQNGVAPSVKSST